MDRFQTLLFGFNVRRYDKLRVEFTEYELSSEFQVGPAICVSRQPRSIADRMLRGNNL